MHRNQDKMNNMRGKAQQQMSDSLDDNMMSGDMQSMQGKNMNKKGQNKMSMNKQGLQNIAAEMHDQDNCDNTQHKHNKQRDAAPSFAKSAAADAENMDDDIQRQSQWGRN